MRFRLMATYRGVPYQAGLGPGGTEATLFSLGPPPEELGFAAAPGHWRKQVSVTDLDALWQSRPAGDYRGEPCLVLDDLGDRLHIAYLGRDATRAAQLGYWEIDREVFEVVVARRDVTGLTEERVDFPLAAAMFPPSGTGPGVPAGAQAGAVGEPLPSLARHAASQAAAGPAGYAAAAGNGSAAVDSEPGGNGGATGRRTGRKDRASPESVFAELLALAAIPQAAYAVGQEVPGSMCLVKADGGFEVFGRTDDARLDMRFFEDEEAAYFYLFGVLAAEAVRSGRLGPRGPGEAAGGGNASGAPGASTGNVSKYLRGGNLPKQPSRPARVYLAGGADGPPLPKQPRRPLDAQVRKSILRFTN
jgi:hypothetical protein